MPIIEYVANWRKDLLAENFFKSFAAKMLFISDAVEHGLLNGMWEFFKILY